ncbi:MAG: 50S ribosomal protein L17 [Phycisphaerales bacterium]|nr:MAG: 50S ribosomal protein L17 [Phycisphaerales bacterium]
MRHRIRHRKLNRTSEHRKALLRNLSQNLIEHGQITTTLPKAKALRPFIERLVTLAVEARKLTVADDTAGALRARRTIHKLLGDRGLIPKDHRDSYAGMTNAHRAKTTRMLSGRRYRTGEPKGRLAFTAESVTHRLIETVAPRYENRPGGYTRLVRLANRRIGDCSPLAVLQLVGDEEAPVSLAKPGRSARRRRADARYSMAARAAKSWAKVERAAESGVEAPAETEDESPDTDSNEPQGRSGDVDSGDDRTPAR